MAHVCTSCLDSYSRHQRANEHIPGNPGCSALYYEMPQKLARRIFSKILDSEFFLYDFCKRNSQLLWTLEKLAVGLILFWIFYQRFFKYLTYFLWNTLYVLCCITVSGLLFIFLSSQKESDSIRIKNFDKSRKKLGNENYRRIDPKASDASLSEIEDRININTNSNKLKKKLFVDNKRKVTKRRKLNTIVDELDSDSDNSCIAFRHHYK